VGRHVEELQYIKCPTIGLVYKARIYDSDFIEWLKDYFLDLYLCLIFESQLFLVSGYVGLVIHYF